MHHKGVRGPPHRRGRLFTSTQRELNPPIRHGKAAGSRYIMGAFDQLAGAVGFEPTPGGFGDCHAAVTPHPCFAHF